MGRLRMSPVSQDWLWCTWERLTLRSPFRDRDTHVETPVGAAATNHAETRPGPPVGGVFNNKLLPEVQRQRKSLRDKVRRRGR